MRRSVATTTDHGIGAAIGQAYWQKVIRRGEATFFGATATATNAQSAGAICSRRDAATLASSCPKVA
jgi:hypothetical protein